MSSLELFNFQRIKKARKKRIEDCENHKVWLGQLKKLILQFLDNKTTLLEVGCAKGDAYNFFKEFNITYTGIDCDADYINRAKEKHLDTIGTSFINHDISIAPLPSAAQIVVCSSTLEFLPSLFPALQHITDSCSKILVLRTFLGIEEKITNICSGQLTGPYPQGKTKNINQYAFKDILGFLAKEGFKTNILCDEATFSVPQNLSGVSRNYYIVYSKKQKNPKNLEMDDTLFTQNCSIRDLF